ncbi:NADPH:quinone oxidoreductase family protein [Achromobacter pestifer]|uniref:L-threonine 3-dehydrogenase n=1 Tax=Achromobacter pestifer TaxID=1353889 RepID=A0A6S6ZLQ7_9BURK|nr:NADPH:quinone oxidoreductase family protein [Achromobacter pestifer]CAB3653770.1 L-threonine 3-dehydrogenase [Achromobacter pestifer]
MRAVICRGLGDPSQVSVETGSAPPMFAGGVRIAVHSCGVSFANLLVLQGKHQNRPALPLTPGTEVAGIVTECAPDVTLFRPGDRVVAGVRSGGFASEVVAPEDTTFALPYGVDFDSAVQFPTIYATAYGALCWRARLQPGETVLVHGASGGSGLAAIEISKKMGAKVIACASTQAKLDAACAHGADTGLNYRDGEFRDAVLSLTDGRGADVIFDPVGGKVFEESLRCVAPEGRLIPMGFAGGDIPQIPANILLVKNATAIGIYWGYYMGWGRVPFPPERRAAVRAAFATLSGWVVEGALKPYTQRTFALESYEEALAVLASREVIGRVALHPQRFS